MSSEEQYSEIGKAPRRHNCILYSPNRKAAHFSCSTRHLELLLAVLCLAGCTFLSPSERHPAYTRHLVATACPSDSSAHIVTTNVPGSPFQALASRRGRWVFVSLMPSEPKPKLGAAAGSIGVLVLMLRVRAMTKCGPTRQAKLEVLRLARPVLAHLGDKFL